MDTLLNSKHSWSRKNCSNVLKSVPLDENDSVLLKLTVLAGILPSFQGFKAENGYYITFQVFLEPKNTAWTC